MSKLLEEYYRELEFTMTIRAETAAFLSKRKHLLVMGAGTVVWNTILGAIRAGAIGALSGLKIPSRDTKTLHGETLLKKSSCDLNGYRWLVNMESSIENDGYKYMINAQCTEIETEFRDSLRLKTLDTLGENILNAYASDKEKKVFLEKFLSGEREFTFSAIKYWIRGLERNLQTNNKQVLDWFNSYFDHSYKNHLVKEKLSAFISRLSDRYRNPSAHGRKSYNNHKYSGFCQYVYGQASLSKWFKSRTKKTTGHFNKYLIYKSV